MPNKQCTKSALCRAFWNPTTTLTSVPISPYFYIYSIQMKHPHRKYPNHFQFLCSYYTLMYNYMELDRGWTFFHTCTVCYIFVVFPSLHIHPSGLRKKKKPTWFTRYVCASICLCVASCWKSQTQHKHV